MGLPLEIFAAQDVEVQTLIASLRPRPGFARTVMLVRRLRARFEEGDVDKLSTSTFKQWAAKATENDPKTIQRCLATAKKVPDEVLQVFADEVPKHGQQTALKEYDGGDPHEFIERWKARRATQAVSTPTGECFERGGIRLICDDARKAGPQPYRMILVDPPYKYDRDVRGLGAMDGDKDGVPWATQFLVDHLAPRGTLAMWAGGRNVGDETVALTAAGLTIHQVVRWEKPNLPDHLAREFLIVAGRHPFRPRGSVPPLVFDTYPNRHPLRDGHQSPKPPELMVPIIEALTDPGDTVFDGFAGTGPVAVAALRTGRRYEGYEINPRHFTTAREEIEKAFAVEELAA